MKGSQRERRRRRNNWRPCYKEDEGRSLEIALQEEVSNRLKVPRLKVKVLNVQEKAGKPVRCVPER